MNTPSSGSSPYSTVRVEPADTSSGFRCGKHPLDDYFKRHALKNDEANIGRTYVLRGEQTDPVRVLGFYTLSMAQVVADQVAAHLPGKAPRYPLPAALIGRLAVDERVHGRRLGEKLLLDALQRIADAADILGCVGAIVDAKDEDAERFYQKYDITTVYAETWPRRMFLPIGILKDSLAG